MVERPARPLQIILIVKQCEGQNKDLASKVIFQGLEYGWTVTYSRVLRYFTMYWHVFKMPFSCIVSGVAPQLGSASPMASPGFLSFYVPTKLSLLIVRRMNGRVTYNGVLRYFAMC